MPTEMSRIIDCEAINCVYNKGKKCHTLAITVGDELEASCDTFFPAENKGGFTDINGGVGACKISNVSTMTPLNAPHPNPRYHTRHHAIAALISLKRVNHPAGWKASPTGKSSLYKPIVIPPDLFSSKH
jgi:hypothetical protein